MHRTTVMEQALAAAHPELRSYAGQSLDTPGRSVVLDVTPLGLHASVRGPGGDYLVGDIGGCGGRRSALTA